MFPDLSFAKLNHISAYRLRRLFLCPQLICKWNRHPWSVLPLEFAPEAKSSWPIFCARKLQVFRADLLLNCAVLGPRMPSHLCALPGYIFVRMESRDPETAFYQQMALAMWYGMVRLLDHFPAMKLEPLRHCAEVVNLVSHVATCV